MQTATRKYLDPAPLAGSLPPQFSKSCASVTREVWHIIRGMSPVSWKIQLRRLPANLISNRLWIVWGGSLYLRFPYAVIRPSEDSTKKTSDFASDAKTFVKWSALPRLRHIDASRLGIFPAELGRFGNMVRRMANAFLLAHRWGIGNLIVPRRVIFWRGLLSEGLSTYYGGVSVWFGVAPRFPKNNVDALITTNFLQSFPSVEKSYPESLKLSWGRVRSLLQPDVPLLSSGAQVLTIHVRGGDVFGPRKPTAYGQPPFSYYQLILESRKWENVVLVHEDMTNPVTEMIISYCQANNLPLDVHSSDLQADLTVLLGAESLVAGRGTFIPAVVGLSPHCRTVYYFEDKMNLIPSVPGIHVIKVRDDSGDYRARVLNNNWENSAEQRDLMVTYPMSSLVIEGS